MKKNKGWYAVLATCLVSLLTGCSEHESVESPAVYEKVVLTGSAETKKVSRSALSDKGEFSWLDGDMIDVYASDGNVYPFDLKEGAGTSNGIFGGTMAEGTEMNFAVSPAGLNPVQTGDGIQLTLPADYEVNGLQTYAPMYGKVEGNGVFFKNLGGLMKLDLRNIKDGCIIEVSSVDHQLAGTMMVTEDADGNSVLKSVGMSSGSMVTLTSVAAESNQSFYVPLPVMEEKVKLNVKVYDGSKTLKVEKNTSMAMARKNMVVMPSITIPESANAEQKLAASAEDTNNALVEAAKNTENNETKEVIVTINSNYGKEAGEEASETVEVVAPIEIPTTLTAPESASGSEGETGTASSVSITFDEVPVAVGDDKIVLTDNQEVPAEGSESKSEVKVAIPEAPVGVEPPSFEISLPTTTVTLSATQETATFSEVWATTADNTLNVAKGVTIKNLYVLSGNVEVTGHIENIVSYAGKTIYVTLSGTGSVGNVSGDVVIEYAGDKIGVDFDNESIADGQLIPYEIANLEQLRSLANRVEQNVRDDYDRPYAECFYVLTADIDLGQNMLWKPIGTENHSFAGVFNGNGHKIIGVMNMGECDNAGFFGRIHRNGTVKNLTIAADIQIISEDVTTSSVVGGFAGNVDHAIFENCHHTGNISIQTEFIGGIVGTATGATIKLCSNTGSLTNLNTHGTVGGMIGIDNGSTLIGCYSTGDITLAETSGTSGGMVGRTYSGASITSCWASGEFLANERGGMFGYGDNYDINSCYWSENIGGIGNGSWYPTNTGTFEGSAPTKEQINYMNVYIVSLGWMYKEDGSLSPIEGNNIPSNPIRPW